MTASKSPSSSSKSDSPNASGSAPGNASGQKITVLRRDILGARRPSNYFWAGVTAIGGVGFFLAGLSSFLQTNLLPFSDLPAQLVFIPQGIAMGFYGTAAILLCTYLSLIIFWNVGGGFNEFNKGTSEARIFRFGFPGKNREIDLRYSLKDVLAVRAEIKEGLNPKRALYLKVKGKGEIPMTRVGQPISLSDLENQGAELARFLQVPLEGL
ncbi:MAG: photosystem I assembly protein Ycf4 [Cyanobacteria bacterium J06626_6]